MKRALVISKTDAWAQALWDHGYRVTHMHEDFTPGDFEEVLCWKRVGADPAQHLASLFGDEYDLYVVHIPESENVERAQRGAAMATAVKGYRRALPPASQVHPRRDPEHRPQRRQGAGWCAATAHDGAAMDVARQ